MADTSLDLNVAIVNPDFTPTIELEEFLAQLADVSGGTTRSDAQLTTSAVAVYTTPASTVSIIEAVAATNVGSGTRTYTIHLVNSGDSANAANTLVDATSLLEGEAESVLVAVNHVLNEGDSLQALADAGASVNLQVSVREVV